MIVLDKLILKDGGGAAVAVARIGRDGSTFRIEISGGVGYDSLAYAAGGKTYIARGQAAECGANVYAAALLRNGAVVAAGGKTDDGEFVSALKAVGSEDREKTPRRSSMPMTKNASEPQRQIRSAQPPKP